MKQPILQVRNLTTKLAKDGKTCRVVDSVSFDLYKGKTLALVGESGCGKTMVALSLLRILPTPPVVSTEGEILYQGRNLIDCTEKELRSVRGAKIAMIFQDPMSALNPVFTIGNQLMEIAELHLNLFEQEGFETVVESLKEVGIPSPEDTFYAYPHQLSGGMKQRVMIAGALMCRPDILIADEPTTALDVTIQAQVLELMQSLQEKMEMAILLITHDMGVVAEMADEVVVMYASQAVERASASELFNLRAHPYTEGLFASRPTEGKRGEKLHVIQGSVPPVGKLPEGCHFHPRCPYRMEVCMKGRVPDFTTVSDSHLAKCWLWEESIRKQEGARKRYEKTSS